MSGISGMLGIGGGAGGSGFSGPEGVDPAQLGTAYNQTQSHIKQQQDFVNALNAQNGLQNQTGVFNQLQNIAAGQGPNPAQAMLNQATGNNIATQGALQAGQRGSSANAGLIARQAAQQGGALQQQAAGQGATMQANQSLNAVNSMGNLAGQQVAQQAQGLQNLNQNGLQQQSNLMGLQANTNSANASMANTRMGQQGQLIGNIMGGIGSALTMAQGGQVPHYAHGTTGVTQNGTYGAIDYSDPAAQQLMAMGNTPMPQMPMQSMDANMAAPMSQPMAQPMAQSMATPQAAPQQPQSGPQSRIGQFFKTGAPPQAEALGAGGNALGKGIGMGLNSLFGKSKPSDETDYSQYKESGISPEVVKNESQRNAAIQEGGLSPDVMNEPNKLANGGKVQAKVSPGERYLDPKDVQQVAAGANPMKVGEKIPGKPKVAGAKDDYANDTVSKTLDEGGIVLPRSVTQSKHPHWAAKKFVESIMHKNGGAISSMVKNSPKGKK